MNIKHIVWDWNGTLLDDLWLSIKAINIVLKRHNLPQVNAKKYLNLFIFPVIEYYKKLGYDFKINSFEKVGTEFIDEYTKLDRNFNYIRHMKDLKHTSLEYDNIVKYNTHHNLLASEAGRLAAAAASDRPQNP